MRTAIVYLLTVLTVSLITLIARRHGGDRQGSFTVFRLPSVYRYLTASMAVFFLCAGAFASFFDPRRKSFFHGEAALTAIGFSLIVAACIGAHIYALKYRLEITAETVKEVRPFRTNEIDFREVAAIVVLNGLRGARDVRLEDHGGAVLLSVGGTIQDFDELVRLVRHGCKDSKVCYRERDRFGEWHEESAT